VVNQCVGKEADIPGVAAAELIRDSLPFGLIEPLLLWAHLGHRDL
jgi:hypothetical protein